MPSIACMEESDLKLYRKIQKGSKLAFDELFRKYYSVLCKFVYLYLQDSDSCQEVVQDAFVGLWNDASKKEIDNIKSYLYTAVKNKALNIIEADKRHNKLLQENYLPEQEDDAEEEMLQEIKPVILQKVNELPEKCKEIFMLTKFEGLSYDEVAEYLNISKKTIENQMGIALKKLRVSLAPYKNLFVFIALISGMFF